MNEQAVYEARLELADFVVEVFHDVPEEAFLADLLDGDLQFPDGDVNDHLDAGFAHLEEFVADNEGRDPAAVQQDLREEYTRVFVGPRPPVLAHETAYREDTEFIGEGLADVEASYAAAGWEPPEDYGEENDFVAVEFAFLRHLIDRQRNGAEEAVGFERVFLDEHLQHWVEAFASDLPTETDEPLFLAGGRVAAGLLAFEDELVAGLL